MPYKRLAVLGFSGVVLITMVAGALRIHSLEQRVASLEKTFPAHVASAAVTPVSSPPFNLTWAPEGGRGETLQLPGGSDVVTSRLPNGAQLPSGATAREFNGMTYYVMPLADNGGAASRR